METNYPVTTANVPHHYFPLAPAQTHQPLQWLLELESDGTIRYSNIRPQDASAEEAQPVIGTNFFELPNLGDLGSFKSDFVGFVKGDRNRQTFSLRTGNGVYDDSTVIVLTRSFDTTETGPSSVVVLMELKRV